jgi:hypothetical protein
MRAATVIGAALIVALSASACGRAVPASSQARDASATEAAQPSAAPPKLLTITYDKSRKPIGGMSVEATAEGLPPNRKVNLVWGTVDGGWVIEDYFHFRGKKYTETTKALGQADVDANGRLSTRFTIPEDYGGVHEVLVTDGGATIAQGGIEVGQTFEMHPAEGPVGTMIELRVTGLGWRTMDSTWVVNWDNQEVGFVSAASTRGSAVARFRATGPAGDHAINVLTGYMGQGYLNHEQAPNAYLPVPGFRFHVTPGRASVPAAYAEPYQQQPIPRESRLRSSGFGGQAGDGSRDAKATAQVSPTQGPGGTRAALSVAGLPANADVALIWGTFAGSRVSGNGFEPQETELARLKTGPDGRLTSTITIPDDLGGLHSLSIRSGDATLARTSFVIETRVVSMTPTSGPAGTPVTIHLKGVGWTEYDNIYVGTYDNAYMGYACGFNTQGDVVIHFTAAGAPGVHIIDFYPGIYQGPEGGQQLYRLPQLTYATDHPGNRIPALRFSFEVTPGPARVPVPPLTGNTRE